jgi:hypothetical protein
VEIGKDKASRRRCGGRVGIGIGIGGGDGARAGRGKEDAGKAEPGVLLSVSFWATGTPYSPFPLLFCTGIVILKDAAFLLLLLLLPLEVHPLLGIKEENTGRGLKVGRGRLWRRLGRRPSIIGREITRLSR